MLGVGRVSLNSSGSSRKCSLWSDGSVQEVSGG